ncbi:MAG TPA: alpha-amylase [Myxococcales bacterium]|nr:alpha-amylase [Myxococcales bacterium]
MIRRLACLLALWTCACDGAPTADAGSPSEDARVVDDDAGPPPPFVEDTRWFRSSVFYELWVRSFQDSDGDGVGDLPGLTSRLDYFVELGVEGLWLMPTYPSPLADSGYDVADYVGVHPDYGTLEDMDTLLTEAHARGLKVYLDLVFNHTSRAHPWFVESQSDPSGPRGDWFVWADEAGEGCEGAAGPFGSVRWTRDETRGQFYFHQFYPEQPDLSFDEPSVREALLDVTRFWLDRGVDGFRLDVPYRYDEDLPVCVHRPGTFDFLRSLREVTDEHDAAMVGETLASPEELGRYLAPDVLQMGFLLAEATIFWVAAQTETAGGLGRAIDAVVAETPLEGGTFATVLGNHDLQRTTAAVADDPGALRVMAATQMTLPGVPFVYYGEELGMLAGGDFIVDSRDSARTPMQWDAGPNAGFTEGAPFLALAPEHETRNVETLRADPDSLWSFYRRLIALRTSTPALTTGTYQRLSSPNRSTLVYWRRHPDGDRLVAANFGRGSAALDLGVPWEAVRDALGEAPVGAVEGGRFRGELPGRTVWVLGAAE